MVSVFPSHQLLGHMLRQPSWVQFRGCCGHTLTHTLFILKKRHRETSIIRIDLSLHLRGSYTVTLLWLWDKTLKKQHTKAAEHKDDPRWGWNAGDISCYGSIVRIVYIVFVWPLLEWRVPGDPVGTFQSFINPGTAVWVSLNRIIGADWESRHPVQKACGWCRWLDEQSSNQQVTAAVRQVGSHLWSHFTTFKKVALSSTVLRVDLLDTNSTWTHQDDGTALTIQILVTLLLLDGCTGQKGDDG